MGAILHINRVIIDTITKPTSLENKLKNLIKYLPEPRGRIARGNHCGLFMNVALLTVMT